MPSLDQTRILPFSAQQIYQLVMDIEKYPEFLPWCKQAKIISHISDSDLHADLLINFKNFFEKYRSDVQFGKLPNNGYFVDVTAIEGPFKTLVNKWKFYDIEPAKCRVEFFINFEFNSFILSKLIGSIFERATEKMMAAFEARALEIYR